MNFIEINEEVLYTQDRITCVNSKDIELLKSKAAANKRKRVRICSHIDKNDSLHEMLIVHNMGIYVRPHKHNDKSESFHIIEGCLDVVTFDDHGNILNVIEMGEFTSGKCFYYRLSASHFHTVIPKTDWVVFHETTNGPFNREDTEFSDWSPPEDDENAQKVYLDNLIEKTN